MSEGGVYTFQASNGDASVNHTFTIFVISKYDGFVFKGVLLPWAIWLGFDLFGEISYGAPDLLLLYHSYNAGIQQQTKAFDFVFR